MEKEGNKEIKWRLYVVYVCAIVFAGAIVFQIFRIQLIEGDDYRKLAVKATSVYRDVPATRGNIYACNGEPLATSVPMYTVHFDANTESVKDKQFYASLDSLSLCLAQLFKDKSKKQYYKELSKARKAGDRYHLIKRQVKYRELKTLKTFPIFRLGRYKGGLIFEQINKREHPFRLLAARTIGYKRKKVAVGIEGAYEQELKGIGGKRLMKKISGGVWMPIHDRNDVDPEDGKDIFLTIDVDIQDVAEQSLMNQLAKEGADHGCVVLMEVKTGFIKAIANLKRNKKGDYFESYNYAIGESTEPGSTFKLMSLVAALEDGKVDIKDSINVEGGKVEFFGKTMTDSHSGLKKISVQEGFELSSNVLFTKMINNAYSKDPSRFVNRLYEMGLGQKLGLEIAGEGTPVIKNVNERGWSGISLPWMSVGYEVRLTPLQTLAFYSAIANDGKLVRPMLVREIKKYGKSEEIFEPTVINSRICSGETIKKVKLCMEGVVERGTGKNVQSELFSIAGKTGTARIANEKYGYGNDKKYSYQATFVGYFPADKPKYSCIVIINSPTKSNYYGSSVAGPVFKQVAERTYLSDIEFHLNQPKDVKPKKAPETSPFLAVKAGKYGSIGKVLEEFDVDYKVNEPGAEWVRSDSTKKNNLSFQKLKLEEDVPSVLGMGLQDALYILESSGNQVVVKGSGKVVRQYFDKKKKNQVIIELS